MALYDAFVSYSHAKDKPIAAALQSAVQKLGKPWYRRRALRVFRDDTSLSATPQLWPAIEQALGQSRYLILLASPEAAASQWVNKEIAYWLEAKSADTLLIAVTDGALAWDNATNDFTWGEGTTLPPALKGRFAAEPKWVDLTAYRDGADKGDAKFTELAADFAAAIRGMPKEDLLSQEVRQQRKALMLAWSAAGSLLILAGLAGWQTKTAVDNERAATEQKQIAQSQSEIAKSEGARAERNFGAAKSTIDDVVYDLVQGLQDIEGLRAQTARRILERVDIAVGQLAAKTDDDPQVRRSQAVMYDLFSKTYLELGATQLALDYARRAIDISRMLAGREPTNAKLQVDLSISFSRMGNVLLAQGDLTGALAAYREGLEIFRALAVKNPDNAQWRHGVSVGLSKVADVLLEQRDLVGALTAYREVLDIRRALSAETPDNTQWQRDLSVTLQRIGDVLIAQGDPTKALPSYREGLDINRALAAQDPDNVGWRRDVAIATSKVGDVLRDQGDRLGALAAFRESLASLRELAAKDKDKTGWLRDLTVGLEKVGDVLAAQDDTAGALAAYRESLEIRRALVAKDPANAQWRHDVTVSLNRVGDMLVARGNRPEARAAYRECLDLRRALAGKDPNNTQWQMDVVVSLYKLATKTADEPRARLSEALAILKKVKSEGRLASTRQEWIEVIEGELAQLAQAGGR